MNPNPIPDYIKDKIRQQANNCCEYCLSLQKSKIVNYISQNYLKYRNHNK